MAEGPAHEDLPCLYRSDELPGPQRTAFEGHLASCADCRAALERLDWALKLARAAQLTPSHALVRRAVGAALEPAPGPGWLDSLRAAGMGLGLAFAAGLFLFKVSRPAPDALAWRSGMSTEISELAGRIGRLDMDLSLDVWNEEFSEGLDELNRSQQGLKSQLAKPEVV